MYVYMFIYWSIRPCGGPYRFKFGTPHIIIPGCVKTVRIYNSETKRPAKPIKFLFVAAAGKSLFHPCPAVKNG